MPNQQSDVDAALAAMRAAAMKQARKNIERPSAVPEPSRPDPTVIGAMILSLIALFACAIIAAIANLPIISGLP